MMGRILRRFAVFLVTAAFTAAAAVFAAPSLIMGVAMDRIEAGAGANAWSHSPPVTPQAQPVIRSSPDLAYSACLFDLALGPVRLKFTPGTDYSSLSLYAANTDNFYAVNDSKIGPEGIEIALIRRGARPPEGAKVVVEAPSRRGLALERRLAPTPEAFAAADALRRTSICAPWTPLP